ncbi:hypothetical protein [Halopiger goleimassiliensis]|uniref:hypothetical protein n=1 Tax=Halopiger goleimassiliensis TaxID=1293048 RepID=UPI0006780C47|nr:hypothetical protein [Halopiger goleimassiliensis]
MYEKPIGRPERDPLETLVGVLTAADRYDLVLAVIPVAFAVALVATHAFGVAMRHAVTVASVVGVLAIADACYLHPPTDQGSA